MSIAKGARLLASERGASALIVAISMFVLMGFSALVVDVGAGFNERAQDQSTADAAVMAGVLAFGGDDTLDSDLNGNAADDSQADVVYWVLDYARSNLPTTYGNPADPNDPAWVSLWRGCSDPGRPIDFEKLPEPVGWATVGTPPADGLLECISMSASFVRVNLPNQTVGTTFARVLGFQSLETNAFAVATVAPTSSGSALKPFALRGGEGTGEVCLQTAAGGTAVPPCDGPEDGSFGTIVSPAFGHSIFAPPRPPKCTALTGNGGILDDNVALGVDHFLGRYRNPGWVGTYPRTDSPSNNDVRNNLIPDAHVDDCSLSGGVAVADDGVPIDTVLIDTGNVKDEVTDGLITGNGTSTYVPLLQQDGPFRKLEGSGGAEYLLNNKPLWDYLLPVGTTGVASCNRALISAGIDDAARSTAMNTCLADADTAAKQVFDDSIADSPRFGWVPQVWHDNFASGQSWRPVYAYRIVYLAGVFVNCSGVSCGVTFYPGPDNSDMCDPQGANCKAVTVNQMTAFLMANESVSKDVLESFPGGDLGPFEPTLFR